MEVTATELELAAKLATKKMKVRELVSGIVKTGKNEMQHYNYATELEVVKAMRVAMSTTGLDFSMKAESCEITHQIPTKSGQMAHFLLHITCTLTDIHTGYSEHFPWLSAAADSGDKAIQKALTSGVKYFLMKTFLLPTGDDLESFTDVDEPPKKQAQTPKQTSKEPDQNTSVPPQTVTDRAWEQFQMANELPAGFEWDRARFEAAIKGRFKGHLPTKEESIPKVLAAVPPIECWRALDETNNAA